MKNTKKILHYKAKPTQINNERWDLLDHNY